jgi:hypothetical protein
MVETAAFLLGAGQARVRMAGQDRDKVFLPHRPDSIALSYDVHSLPDFRTARSHRTRLTFHLDHAKAAIFPELIGIRILYSLLALVD